VQHTVNAFWVSRERWQFNLSQVTKAVRQSAASAGHQRAIGAVAYGRAMINNAARLPVSGTAGIGREVSDPEVPEPDGKDWTWVLERPCSECGFDAADVDREAIAAELLVATPRWQSALRRHQVRVRPDPTTWSVLEYACHARDVHVIFGQRTRLMLDQENPEFENWDQDQTAIEKRYWAADPDDVAREIEVAGKLAAAAFTGLSAAQWSRAGRRSNGSAFTTETLGLYYLHDVAHHLHDVDA
jgi:hypothetical protein